MSAPAGSIDLGELPRGEEPEIDVGWPGMARLRRRWRHARRLVGAAAAVAVTLVLGGGAAWPEPALTLQLTVRAADYTLAYDSHRLYVFEYSDHPEQTMVAAYRLDDGTVAWRTWLPGGRSYLELWDELLLVVTDTAQLGEEAISRTTRLDPDSGEPMWTQNGMPAAGTGGHVLLSQPAVNPNEEGYESTYLRAVDASTGTLVWSVEAGAWQAERRYTADRLVTLDRAGMLASYDIATGEQLARAPTVASTDPADYFYPTIYTIDPVTFVLEDDGGELVLQAYDAATLQRRWTLTGIGDKETGTTAWPVPCGELVCVGGDQVPHAIDPASGRLVWSAGWLRTDTGGESYDVYGPDVAQLAQYVVVSRWSPPDDLNSWLVELATGRPVLELRDWWVGGYQPAPADQPALLTRGDETVTWFGRLLPDLSGIAVLGAIESATVDDDGPATNCLPAAAHVICQRDQLDGDQLSYVDIEVWELPG